MATKEFLNKQNDEMVLFFIALVGIVLFVINQKLVPMQNSLPDFNYKLSNLNSFLSGSCIVLLTLSLWVQKKRNLELPEKFNLTSFLLSSLFFKSYVKAHYFIPYTIFGDVNHSNVLESNEMQPILGIKGVYLIIFFAVIFLKDEFCFFN